LQSAALVFLLDQFTKFLVVSFLPYRSSYPFRGFFRFTHTHNTGSAFGILQGMNDWLIWISVVGVIVLIMIYRSQPRPSNLLRLSLALQLGGAFGNLVDRVRWGWVTDFIDIGPWPIFNLADASIVTGLILLAWILTRHSPPETSVNALDWCPVCDGEMGPIPGGWHCTTCGVKERIDAGYTRLDKRSTPSAAVPSSQIQPDIAPAYSRDLPDLPDLPEADPGRSATDGLDATTSVDSPGAGGEPGASASNPPPSGLAESAEPAADAERQDPEVPDPEMAASQDPEMLDPEDQERVELSPPAADAEETPRPPQAPA
jgi:signal peptidase II